MGVYGLKINPTSLLRTDHHLAKIVTKLITSEKRTSALVHALLIITTLVQGHLCWSISPHRTGPAPISKPLIGFCTRLEKLHPLVFRVEDVNCTRKFFIGFNPLRRTPVYGPAQAQLERRNPQCNDAVRWDGKATAKRAFYNSPSL